MSSYNAPYPRNSADVRKSLAHTRNFSSLSNATLFTSSSHSQPTDPLLQHTLESTTTENYYDRITQQPRNDPVASRLRWNEPLAYSGLQAPISEKPGYLCKPSRPKRSFKRAKFYLELIVGIWTTYNAVRYFLALLYYNESAGQFFCLALGTSAGVASILTHCSMLLSIFNGKILFQDDETIFIIQALLRLISSFCLLGPAVVNLALAFLWKNSQNPDFDLRIRCQYDVDVVWSVKRNECPLDKMPSSWTPWIVLSSFRLAMTILIIILYQKLFWFPDRPQHSSHRHVHAESCGVTSRQPSESTLIGESPSRQQARVRLIHSRSSEISVKGSSAEHASFGRPILGEAGDEVEFADRFRSLVLQITQETEDAVAIARSDGSSSSETAEEYTSTQIFPNAATNKYDEDYDNFIYNSRRHNNENVFNLPYLPPTLGYNEFGLPYPPVSNVRVLNGFIRRMPTIESQGSWEVTSSLGPSNHGHSGTGSNHTSSRRTTSLTITTTDFSGSNPASRANSLCIHPEMSAGLSPVSATSEQGELLGRSGQRLSASSAEYPYVAASNNTHETRSSSGSRNTTSSYRTAAMGGAHPSAVYHDGIPVQSNDV